MVSKVLLCSYYSVVGDFRSIPSIAVQLLPVLNDFFIILTCWVVAKVLLCSC